LFLTKFASQLIQDKVVKMPNMTVTVKSLMTSLPRLFAAGDVRLGSTKQAAFAAEEGATVALMIREYLKRVG
jgi:thioredoxin reductase